MKALYVRPASGDGSPVLPDVRLYADSAIGRDVMPLFIPDIYPSWQVDVCLGLRVSRLGKNIPVKFANRYIDAIGAVAVLRQREHPEFELSGASSIMDSMVTTGTWVDVHDTTLRVQISRFDGHITDNGIAIVDLERLGVAECISQVSRFATIKSGDILILAATAVTMPLAPDTWIDAFVGDQRTLHLKVK